MSFSTKNQSYRYTNDIIRYYQEGYSQKDIRRFLSISLREIREILMENGFSTGSYRSISLETKNIIGLLIYQGYPYHLISQILDVSFHVIRELKEYRDLEPSVEKGCIHDNIHKEFIHEFKKGYSFLLLYEYFNLEMADVIPLAEEIIRNNVLVQHKEQLLARIDSMLKDEYPVHMIGKKLRISVSVVKQEAVKQNKTDNINN